MHVPAGVPRGTRIGHWFFFVMINEMQLLSDESFHIWKLADDKTVSEIVLPSCPSSLQQVVKEISPWSCENHLQLNLSKCEELIFPHADYNTALCSAGFGSLADRRDAICAKFISKAKTTPPLSYILTNRCIINHGYQLRSGQPRYEQVKGHTERFSNFVTVRFK